MFDWQLSHDGQIHLDKISGIAAGIVTNASGESSIIFRVFIDRNDRVENGYPGQFLVSPRQAAKIAEMLATAAKNALS